jgi:hypothetical protein
MVQMNISIVGYGRMGKTYDRALRNLGHRLTCVVDKDLELYSKEQLLQLARLTDLWIISNPTELHLRTAQTIASMQSKGRILIEKPLCSPDQYDDLSRFLNSTSAKVIMSDIYGRSGLIGRFRDYIGPASIKKIAVEFSKNRTADEANGRFVDKDFGILGYEWFHMLSVIRGMLDAETYGHYLNSHDSEFYSQAVGCSSPSLPFAIECSRIGGLEVSLCSSIRGDIFRERCWSDLIDKMSPDAKVMKGRGGKIPVGSDETVRYISIETTDGLKHILHYEPFYHSIDDYKNVHLMATLNHKGVKVRSEIIHCNQLQEFLKQLMNPHSDSFQIDSYLAISQKLTHLRDRIQEPGNISYVACKS